MLEVLSLGAGKQSSALLLMSVKGALPKLDCAIFADTQWEPPAVYDHLEKLINIAGRAGIPVYRITKGNIREDMTHAMVRGYDKGKGKRWASMPFYTRADGKTKEGQINRQCTSEYKIEIIEKFIKQELLGLKPRQRAPKEILVHQWIGISSDEAMRARPPWVKRAGKFIPISWKSHDYPLLGLRLYPDGHPEEINLSRLSRLDCEDWIRAKYPELKPVKSACVGCPYHSDEEWRRIKADPELWQDAISFDEAIRKCRGMRGKTFLHRSCKPLVEIDFSSLEDNGQINLFNDECSGMCGV